MEVQDVNTFLNKYTHFIAKKNGRKEFFGNGRQRVRVLTPVRGGGMVFT